MTLMKSLLLGSAAGLVAVASAQAADLPTRKGAPAAEYVRICSITVAGKPIVGWTLPGSDTCFKIGGYVTAQIEGGNLSNSQTLIYSGGDYLLSLPTKVYAVNQIPMAATGVTSSQTAKIINITASRSLRPMSRARPSIAAISTRPRTTRTPAFGFSTRANISLDAASNTAYGPLYAHIELQFESGNGFDNVDTAALHQCRVCNLGGDHRR